jgi:cytosine/adenosine deaminase-related metal-dependent hydrolase
VTATLLVRGRAVLTGRLDQPEIGGGAVAVDGARITAVGPYAELRRRYPHASLLGSTDRIVMPGLVSAHQHGGGATSVQLGCADQPFERWLVDMLRIPPLDVRRDTSYHALRLLENGITTSIHSHYVRDPSRYASEVHDILSGYADVGLRVAFVPHYIDRNFLTYGEDEPFLASLPSELRPVATSLCVPPIDLGEYLSLVDELSDNADAERTRILYGPVAPQWCTKQALERIGHEASRTGRGAHMHLLETPAQRRYLDRELGESVVTRLDDVGLVGPKTSFAHGVHLRTEEMTLLAERGTTVVLNPGCNLRLGNGIAPVAHLLSAGVPLAVGTDDMTLNDDDQLFGELRLVAGLARVGSTWPSAAELLHALTAAGAVAAGLGDEVGTLDVGKRADLVLLDARRLTEPAVADDVSILELTVARAAPADVRTVVLNGEVVLADGQWLGGDRQALVDAVSRSADSDLADASRRQFAGAVTRLAAARANWNAVA